MHDVVINMKKEGKEEKDYEEKNETEIILHNAQKIERLDSTIPSFKVEKWNSKIEKVVKLIEKQCRLYKKMHNEVSISNAESPP